MTEYLIPARPTTYRGIRMRSRLEASFAADFDRAGVDWTYEPRAFANQHGQYLPDFLILDGHVRTYAEVKPTLEMAWAILPRIQIIRESDPDAWLVVYVGDLGEYCLVPFGAHRDVWRWTPYA